MLVEARDYPDRAKVRREGKAKVKEFSVTCVTCTHTHKHEPPYNTCCGDGCSLLLLLYYSSVGAVLLVETHQIRSLLLWSKRRRGDPQQQQRQQQQRQFRSPWKYGDGSTFVFVFVFFFFALIFVRPSLCCLYLSPRVERYLSEIR